MNPAENESGRVTSQIGPSAFVPVWTLKYLKGAEVAVYVALRSFADREGYGYPRTKTIAERAGVAVNTVRNAIQKMRSHNLLTTSERRRPDGSLAGLDYFLIDVDPGGGVTSSSDKLRPGETRVSAGQNQSLHQGTPVTSSSDPRTHQENTPINQDLELEDLELHPRPYVTVVGPNGEKIDLYSGDPALRGGDFEDFEDQPLEDQKPKSAPTREEVAVGDPFSEKPPSLAEVEEFKTRLGDVCARTKPAGADAPLRRLQSVDFLAPGFARYVSDLPIGSYPEDQVRGETFKFQAWFTPGGDWIGYFNLQGERTSNSGLRLKSPEPTRDDLLELFVTRLGFDESWEFAWRMAREEVLPKNLLEAQAFLRTIPLELSVRERAELTPLVRELLDLGWERFDLAEASVLGLEGMGSPVAVFRSRLRKLVLRGSRSRSYAAA